MAGTGDAFTGTLIRFADINENRTLIQKMPGLLGGDRWKGMVLFSLSDQRRDRGLGCAQNRA